jgi:ribosomal protein L30E
MQGGTSKNSKRCIDSPFERVSKNIHYEKVAKLQAKLKNNKTFMNMAVHDMRNPTNAIIFGVNETIQMLKNQKKKIDSIRKMRKQRRKNVNLYASQIIASVYSSDISVSNNSQS